MYMQVLVEKHQFEESRNQKIPFFFSVCIFLKLLSAFYFLLPDFNLKTEIVPELNGGQYG